ncbi:hypothetical protein HRR83_008309 [Exophiala dermatitidis]|uniref:Vacuolar sorting protein Vps3844 C-terminal domain-containing protein n=2 Tax=Exophiala dermatitidis TaxID=5970 RepID=H6C558_EXODN|nr:uncharacterized protein HMPREF1120_07753 [Exophiala dermatitidis NIH/UT8656]KAJ4505477.1 hypothetical protein HRR75_007346 [Exophiala dermatitidis]EHY59770.1 hypothetical protein HMPREF1120_07753 [Exophiala dermatitidis NIH/UT8656]KAJ4507080.1 hypothetical protein HRR73_007901 [Exophiala dermatitidis]KAJ4507676.1 hypothetical protein HRR74_008003 [Exophiala dermatitidis]KAJ4533021.1 hypothetical protein HRR76_007992 [Exophiala dermatitidis]
MKTLAALLPCVALLQHVAAQGAYLFTVDPEAGSQSPSTSMIDSKLASAILARRRGLTADRKLEITEESLLQDINAYGGYQAPLFPEGQQPTETPGKLFIRISGVDMQIDDFDTVMPDLWIQEPGRDLLTDFKVIPKRHKKDSTCEYIVPPSLNAVNGRGVEVIFSYPMENEPLCLAASEIPNIPIIMSLHGYLPTNPTEVKEKLPSLVRILKHLSAADNVESTLLLLPSKLGKQTHQHKVRAPKKVEETPLDLPADRSSSPAAASNSSQNFTLPSVIPECFASKSACENTTNSCSGHGSCYQAHTNCFKCRCGTTVARVNEDGTKKTIQWGGAACQKKDVSTPFILFAGFGVVLAALIAGAIGMLFNMGREELPSVIGAGVAGPKAGK